MSFHKTIICGRLGDDPELRHTQGGQAVCNLSVAVNERWNDKQGQKQERTTWYKVVVWGKQAEHCEKYLTKGREVLVEGRIQTDSYEDRDGNTRYTWELVAQNVTFLSGGDAKPNGSGQRRNPPAQEDWQDQFNDDDIPF